MKQPFADLLALGEKTIELRKWNTNFRGEFLIHASKKIDVNACERLDIDNDNLSIGTIIGSAFLYDESIVIKKTFTEINKNIFLLFQNILMVTNMDF